MMQKGTLSLAVVMILSSGATNAEEQIRNNHFKANMDGWWNAGANIATESNEACIDIKNPGKSYTKDYAAVYISKSNLISMVL